MTDLARTFVAGLAIGSVAGSAATIFLIAVLHAAAPKSHEERIAEDEAQMQALIDAAKRNA